jgi:Putative DNA-binding domain
MPWEPITTVEQLIARFENSTLDYKVTYDVAQRATRADLASDVAAFSNAFGGTIVVGVHELGGKAVKLEGVADVSKLLVELKTALLQHCVPVPSTPEEHEIVVAPEHATRLLVPRAAAPATPVTLVTLNVRPDPRGPIGVRHYDENRKEPGPVKDAFRFPVRVDDHTRFIDPTELPMWMNSHERRVAIFLREALGGARELSVRAHYRKGDNQQQRHESDLHLSDVDEAHACVTVRQGVGAGAGVTVPFAFIVAVWPRSAGSWSIAIQGSMFAQQGADSVLVFRPYLGGA